MLADQAENPRAVIGSKEEWRSIDGFEAYEVSSFGRVRRVIKTNASPSGHILTASIRERLGYLSVCLSINGVGRNFLVHRLVCRAFHGQSPEGKPHVAHWDGDLTNNRSDNLRWVDPKENAKDKRRHGRVLSGEKVVAAKLTEEAVREIRDTSFVRGASKILAAKYGVCQRTIADARKAVYWKGVS